MKTRAIVVALVAGFAMTAQAQSRAQIPAGEWTPLSAELARAYNAINQNSHEPAKTGYPVHLTATAKLKTSELPVALVDLGGLGASTDAVKIAVMLDGRPVLARVRDQRGQVWDEGDAFAEGAGVLHRDAVEIDAADDAVVTKGTSMNGESFRLTRCELNAYHWNPESKTFEWSHDLSARLATPYCAAELKRSTLLKAYEANSGHVGER